MQLERLYLDHNASAPLRSCARRAVIDALEVVGNPSSVHAEGRRARSMIENARRAVAAIVGGRPDNVIFTSGATEANNLVLAAGWDTIFLGGVEHESVLAPAQASAARVVVLPVDSEGRIAVEAMSDISLGGASRFGRALLTLQAANSETGILQDLAPAFDFARFNGIATHTDAVQHVGRLPFDLMKCQADFVSLSAHKLGGPKGVGALVMREGASVRPHLLGGGQQRYRRAGTEPVSLIAGFGAAVQEARDDVAEADRIRLLRDDLEARLSGSDADIVIIGRSSPRLPNTTAIAMPGRSAESTVIALDLAGIAVSAGAACSSGKVGPSAALAAMGIDRAVASAVIRVSLGATTTAADIDRFCRTLPGIWRSGSHRTSLYVGNAGRAPALRGEVPAQQGD